MPTITRTRYSKYRLTEDRPNIAVTNDDDQILLEVYRHDIIDANTIYVLLAPRSVDKVRRRLRKLHLNQYLQRLAQIEQIHVPGGGSLPVAYTLGVKGAKRLTEAYGLAAKPDRYRDRGKTLSSQHVLHALEQTRFLVSCRKSAEAREHLEFLYPDQIYARFAPEILKRDSLPSVVAARVNWHGYAEREGTIPDGFFMLHYKNLPEGRNRRAIFVEIDRGTETIDVSDRKSIFSFRRRGRGRSRTKCEEIFGVAPPERSGGGRCASGWRSGRTLRVRLAMHAARAKSGLALEMGSRKG